MSAAARPPAQVAALGRWAAIWVALALFSGSWLVTVDRVESAGATFDRALAIQLVTFLLWGIVAVPMVRAARRVPWVAGHRLAALGARVALALGAALLHSLLQAALLTVTLPPGLMLEAWRAAFGHLIRFQLHFNVLIAGLVLCADLALGLYRRSAERRLEAARLEESLIKARLAASRLRLRPRFLFDALATVRTELAAAPAVAERLVLELASLLRAVLESSRHPDSTVRDELELARLFLDLERVRLGARLDSTIEAEADALALELPSLILVPLLDEAIASCDRGGGDSIHVVLRATSSGAGGTIELRVAFSAGAAPAIGEETLIQARDRLRESFGDAPAVIELAPAGDAALLLRVVLPPPALSRAERADPLDRPQEVLWSRS